MKHTNEELKQMQSLPLDIKIKMTKQRIKEWYEYYCGQVYVSFSGGKGSTVLLHLVREMYPDVEAVFVNTGLEYPEIQKFVKTFDNVTILRPEMRFDEVVKTYGYPVISKEISEKIYAAKNNSNPCAHKQFDGTYISKNGKTNKYDIQKYKPLLESDFNASHKCCVVMKKNPVKKFEKATGKTRLQHKWQVKVD